MERVGRREILIGAGAGTLALTGFGLTATSAAADDNSDHNNENQNEGLTGGWLINRSDANGSALAVVTFADGGAVASRDIDPAGPPGFGTWAGQGDNRFVATFYEGDVGPSGPSGPSAVVKVIVHGSWEDDDISGTYEFTVTSSGQVLASGPGSFSGTRVEAGE